MAERAGVALGTVSNVLNRPEKVAEATRLRVLQAIEELGFVRNDAARQLRAGRSRTLGLVVLDVSNPFFTDVARGAEDRAAKEGLSILLGNSDEAVRREAAYMDLFEEQRVQGLLISPIGDVFARLERLRERGTPTVLVDRLAQGHPFSSVSVDDVAGGHLAVSHLIEQGCRRLAFVGGPLTILQVADRLKGANRAVAEHPGVTLEVMSHTGLTVHNGRATGEIILNRPVTERPDGIFAANDLVAVGLLQAFAVLNAVDVPHDIAMVGYDDIDFASATVVPLSSVRQPSALIGQTAVDLLLQEVEAMRAGLPFEHQQIVYQPELVIRESSLHQGALGND
ncbi:LacI family transcriptional regulator [Microlunatus panaciterrae]|uniref:LacI family transcriptional regulator n=1 Tax=Microlunatus panaciterrae TaxID=400768 RepID=A0ABS2RMD4_9ACTN|nr:LacI family transcriptional regulator [Microlunatus panaciterrae]